MNATLALGIAAAVGFAADAYDVVTNVAGVVNEEWKVALEREDAQERLTADAETCVNGASPVSGARFNEAALFASLYLCSDGVGVLHFWHDDGRIDTQTVYSPLLGQSTAAAQGGRESGAEALLKGFAMAFSSAAHAEEPVRASVIEARITPADVAQIICQKPVERGADLYLLKVKTKAGICVDQIIDKTTGRVVEETENTPCSCDT